MVTDFRRVLISSIFSGRSSAKRSLRVWQEDDQLARQAKHVSPETGLLVTVDARVWSCSVAPNGGDVPGS